MYRMTWREQELKYWQLYLIHVKIISIIDYGNEAMAGGQGTLIPLKKNPR